MKIQQSHIIGEAAKDAIRRMYEGMKWSDAIQAAVTAAPLAVQASAVAAFIEIMTR